MRGPNGLPDVVETQKILKFVNKIRAELDPKLPPMTVILKGKDSGIRCSTCPLARTILHGYTGKYKIEVYDDEVIFYEIVWSHTRHGSFEYKKEIRIFRNIPIIQEFILFVDRNKLEMTELN